MSKFYEIEPTLESYWRSVILFGRNVASYKFALAKSLYDLKDSGQTLIALDQLAVPFAKHITEHLQGCDKQGTSESSRFLNVCRQFNQQAISHDKLLETTVQLGFNNVIDAFHNVHNQELPQRFFIDERKTKGGIVLTDSFFQLGESLHYESLTQETEARWRLVETAWELNLPRHLVQVSYQESTGIFIADNKLRRVPVTLAKPALNGYQKGRCFYCFKEITIESDQAHSADVDHFFPHILRQCDADKPVNGVANLVLACLDCNRGKQGKFEKLPSIKLLERLHSRNEYLITSHHPLRETLIAQTGLTQQQRQGFLQDAYDCATLYCGSSQKWQPSQQGTAIF
ncbi:HNH endonuclease [Moraxellaceae bacterium AER2_44_116]|nr:HNH endonuclease [Moraxellaceae bacterium]TQC99360.1 HNH endonuclease [Moraxellaceae bacterium AER2_44_116]